MHSVIAIKNKFLLQKVNNTRFRFIYVIVAYRSGKVTIQKSTKQYFNSFLMKAIKISEFLHCFKIHQFEID